MRDEEVKKVFEEAEKVQKEKEEKRKTNKAKAVEFFEKKYGCKWKENCHCIIVQSHKSENNFDIRIDLDLDFNDKNFIMFSEYNFEECYTSMPLLEDLLSILHLFYLGDKNGK